MRPIEDDPLFQAFKRDFEGGPELVPDEPTWREQLTFENIVVAVCGSAFCVFAVVGFVVGLNRISGGN